MQLTREEIIQEAMKYESRGYHPNIIHQARMLARLGAAGHDVEGIRRDAYSNIPKELIIKAGREMGLI